MKLNNEKIIALSKTAFKSFTESQIERLQNYAKLIPINIENIEKNWRWKCKVYDCRTILVVNSNDFN